MVSSANLRYSIASRPRLMASGAVKVKCAIAFDSGNERFAEYIRTMLPSEWRPHVSVSTYAQGTDVIEMVRNALPDLLAIFTNLWLLSPDVIEGCVAVSPNTRYLFLTPGWSQEHIDFLLKSCEHHPVSVGTFPCSRAQLIAALEGTLGYEEGSNQQGQ